MSRGLYILDQQGRPTAEPDPLKWAAWIQGAERQVGLAVIGESKVSTVFLGLDHNYTPGGPPILWETMVFGGQLNGDQTRCSGSREQAEAMHEAMVARVEVARISQSC